MNIKNLEQKLFEKYDVEYNIKHKILYIHKPIIVSDFILLKELLKGWEIKDIRVEPRSALRL